MKSRRQRFIEATKSPTLDVVISEDDSGVRHKVMLICPGCGARYYKDTAPPFCLVPRCEFDFTGKVATALSEADMVHATKQAVSRYVMV